MRKLLDYISNNSFPTTGTADSWQFEKVVGGANNLLYKASQEDKKIAVKFTVSDSRNRAQREYDSLEFLSQHDSKLAPSGLLLDKTSYRNPVVVQSWVDGIVLEQPPQNNDEWLKLLLHYVDLHSIDVSKGTINLQKSTLTANSVEEGIELVNKQIKHLPEKNISRQLEQKIANLTKLKGQSFIHLVSFCKTDSNFRNFILQNENLISVDWENSGWGNPHFEIAELITHAAYLDIDESRWEWVIDEYASIVSSQTVKEVIAIYIHIWLVWWLVRLTRYIHEIPQRQDERLTKASFHNVEAVSQKFLRYLQRVERSESFFL